MKPNISDLIAVIALGADRALSLETAPFPKLEYT